jgi:hypothetical protein
MAFRLSKLSLDRLQGVHRDLVRTVKRAVQITTQDFRVQDPPERLASTSAASKPRMNLISSSLIVWLMPG